MDFPYILHELSEMEPGAAALFRRSFALKPPAMPRHFVALLRSGETAGYIHFTSFESQVYLCGGLCVDARHYRNLTEEQRQGLKAHGSLSRWLMRDSTAALGSVRAVFAYTGVTRSRRDAFALGYVEAAPHLRWFSRARRHLLVQWHDVPAAERRALARRVSAFGPF